ncbi:MAG: NUDIX domain-containing protein [Candidatus Moranbacteria bacterium]|nr:NUDIX domain-containing protein [Candidatus Moranbacteria bacterium]
MKEILLLNPENVSEEEVATYDVRHAARAVVTDADGLIALLHVGNDGYYKLPGGGFEGSEDAMAALARECLEEIGCEVRIAGEVGIVTEYRKRFKLKQISYCYTAEVVGQKRLPAFDESERQRGFETCWVTANEAAVLLRGTDAIAEESVYEAGSYILPRDREILEAVRVRE